MGRGAIGLNSSRTEFLQEDAVDSDIDYYKRTGGCFVTTKKAIAFALFALLILISVIVSMYYFGPNEKIIREEVNSDIEKLINESINSMPKELDIRLPHHIYPLNYKLKLHPILDTHVANNFTFTGEVDILLSILSDTNQIVLHWNDIDIPESDIVVTKIITSSNGLHTQKRSYFQDEEKSEEIDLDDELIDEENKTNIYYHPENYTNDVDFVLNATVGTINNVTEETTTQDPEVYPKFSKIEISDTQKHSETNKLIITLKDELVVGYNYTIFLKFSGLILDNFIGLYKTSYLDEGERRWIATTHFESIFARRVFPCFDEPFYRSTFEISIASRTNMSVLSNMPLKESEPWENNAEWVWNHFEKSVPMSTFLVSFTIHDFSPLKSELVTNPQLTIWAPKEDLPKTGYALTVASQMVKFLEDYFGVKHPLPKIDLVVIPNFGQNTQDSLGLLSLRKTSLFLDIKKETMATIINVFTLVAQQVTQKWLGNMVTVPWWSDYLFIKGFQSFTAEVLGDNLRPKWQRYNNFPIRVMHNVMLLDSLKSARSLESDITSNSEIERIEDKVLSDKATCLMRMLNYTITENVLKNGLQNFMNESLYNYPYQDGIWDTFANDILPENMTVKTFMSSWTNQTGYPAVTIKRNNSGNVFEITQKRCIEKNISSDSLWIIPLTYITLENETVHTTWLNERSTEMTINISNNSWILFNIDQTGFYRVNYDRANWRLLQMQLIRDHHKIPVANRAQLLNDAFSLAKLGMIKYKIPLYLTKYLNKKENNYIPWIAALNQLISIRGVINNYEYTGAYDKYLLEIVKDKFDALGTKEDKEEDNDSKQLRYHIIRLACDLRYGPCVKWAQDLYHAWMNTPEPDTTNPIPVDYRKIVQCMAITAGDRLEWEFLYNRTLSPLITPTDLRRAYLSLGCTHDYWLINKYLELSLSKNISLEYVPLVWKSISHPVGLNIGFKFIRINWNEIFSAYEDTLLVFSAIIKDFLSKLSTQVDLEDLTSFYKQHQENLKSVANIMQETVDIIKLQIQWKNDHYDTIISWLKEHFSGRYN